MSTARRPDIIQLVTSAIHANLAGSGVNNIAAFISVFAIGVIGDYPSPWVL